MRNLFPLIFLFVRNVMIHASRFWRMLWWFGEALAEGRDAVTPTSCFTAVFTAGAF